VRGTGTRLRGKQERRRRIGPRRKSVRTLCMGHDASGNIPLPASVVLQEFELWRCASAGCTCIEKEAAAST
jgi:hypothetical protein